MSPMCSFLTRLMFTDTGIQMAMRKVKMALEGSSVRADHASSESKSHPSVISQRFGVRVGPFGAFNQRATGLGLHSAMCSAP